MDESIFEKFLEKLAVLKTDISNLRKEGKDPIISDYLLRNLKSKIEWAKYNGAKEDFEKIDWLLSEAEKELLAESDRKLIDVKKEVNNLFKKKLDGSEKNISKAEKKIIFSQEHKGEKFDLENNFSSDSNSPEQLPEASREASREASQDTSQDTSREASQELDAAQEERPELILTNPQHFFYLWNGKALRSLSDLKSELKIMSEDTFNFHTRNEDNDFSKWLKDVLNQEELSKNIKGVRNKEVMLDLLQGKRGE